MVGWLPHPISTRGKFKYEWLSSTHLPLRTKVNLQKTSSSNHWSSNNYSTVFCSKYWNLTCQIRNAYDCNTKQLNPYFLKELLKKVGYKTHCSIYWKNLAARYRKIIATATIKERIVRFKRARNRGAHFEFRR